MLLSCIGQRSLSNSGVLESLLNLLDNLLSPLQPELTLHRRTEGIISNDYRNIYSYLFVKNISDVLLY